MTGHLEYYKPRYHKIIRGANAQPARPISVRAPFKISTVYESYTKVNE